LTQINTVFSNSVNWYHLKIVVQGATPNRLDIVKLELLFDGWLFHHF
jgi:hypothetical protein